MSYTYTQRKKQENEINGSKPHSRGEESVLPNSAQISELGHQVGMPEVMREKMEDSFGMDLSGVKLYENKAVGDAGAEAVAQGNKIAFAPGKLDFSSTGGQELLGHEISHVASQARGEVQRSGFVNDSALEARADKEGSMAARGQSVTAGYGGASAPLSSASAASAAAPMQAKSGKKDPAPGTKPKPINMIHEPKERGFFGKIRDWFITTSGHIFNKSKKDYDEEVAKTNYERDTEFFTSDSKSDSDDVNTEENIEEYINDVYNMDNQGKRQKFISHMVKKKEEEEED